MTENKMLLGARISLWDVVLFVPK